MNGKKALKGKTIVTFPISSEIDACNTKGQQGYFDAEASGAGCQGHPAAVQHRPGRLAGQPVAGVTDKANAVVMLCGPTPPRSRRSWRRCKAHHIPVIDGNYNQTGGNPAFPTTGLSPRVA